MLFRLALIALLSLSIKAEFVEVEIVTTQYLNGTPVTNVNVIADDPVIAEQIKDEMIKNYKETQNPLPIDGQTNDNPKMFLPSTQVFREADRMFESFQRNIDQIFSLINNLMNPQSSLIRRSPSGSNLRIFNNQPEIITDNVEEVIEDANENPNDLENNIDFAVEQTTVTNPIITDELAPVTVQIIELQPVQEQEEKAAPAKNKGKKKSGHRKHQKAEEIQDLDLKSNNDDSAQNLKIPSNEVGLNTDQSIEQGSSYVYIPSLVETSAPSGKQTIITPYFWIGVAILVVIGILYVRRRARFKDASPVKYPASEIRYDEFHTLEERA